MAGVVTWVAGPSSGLLTVATAGYLPRFWQKTNKHGMATHILLVQAILVTALSIMFVVLPSVQAAYQILSQLTVVLYLVMYLLMFAAGIYLRYSQPNRPRPYRIPGGDVNPYLAVAAMIAAGLDGIEKGLELKPEFTGNESPTGVRHLHRLDANTLQAAG